MIAIRYAKDVDLHKVEALLKELELFHPGFSPGTFVVAEDAGGLVGFANVRRSGGYDELTHVGVLPAYRGRGIARRLIGQLLRDVPGPLYLNTVVPSFFEHLGFERTDHFPRQFSKPEGWCTGCAVERCTSMVWKGTR